MDLQSEIKSTTDSCEDLFYKVIEIRDAAQGPEKTRWRKIASKLDAAFANLEGAEKAINSA